MTDTERKAYYKELAREERRLARAATDPMVAKVRFQIAACYEEIASSRTTGSMPLRPLGGPTLPNSARLLPPADAAEPHKIRATAQSIERLELDG